MTGSRLPHGSATDLGIPSRMIAIITMPRTSAPTAMPIHAPVPKAASLGAARAAALRAVCVIGVAVVWNGDALLVPAKML